MSIPNIKDYILVKDKQNGLFITVDFAQIELCALAEIARDEVLIEDLNNGLDIHRATAAEALGKKLEDVTDKERRAAKSVNFGLIYGASAKTLAKNSGMDINTVEKFIRRFYDRYSKVKRFHDNLKRLRKDFTDVNLLEAGVSYVKLNSLGTLIPTGREFIIYARASDDGSVYLPLTEMKNYPVQGFATGDLVPYVINHILSIIRASNTEMSGEINLVSTVHDDFTLELDCAVDYEYVLSIIEYVFENLNVLFKKDFDFDLQIRYNYDVKIGTTFGDMQKYTRKEIKALINSES